MKTKILFLCTGNSCRSQMAEGWAKHFDYIATLCGQANKTCPFFPGKKIHRGFDDPPKLAANAHNKDEALTHYRRVRDEIRDFVLTLPAAIGEGERL